MSTRQTGNRSIEKHNHIGTTDSGQPVVSGQERSNPDGWDGDGFEALGYTNGSETTWSPSEAEKFGEDPTLGSSARSNRGKATRFWHLNNDRHHPASAYYDYRAPRAHENDRLRDYSTEVSRAYNIFDLYHTRFEEDELFDRVQAVTPDSKEGWDDLALSNYGGLRVFVAVAIIDLLGWDDGELFEAYQTGAFGDQFEVYFEGANAPKRKIFAKVCEVRQ